LAAGRGAAIAERGWCGRPRSSPAPGAMFPYPIYALWSEAYKKESGIGLNYQSVGLARGHPADPWRGPVAFAAVRTCPLQSADLETRWPACNSRAVMGGAVPIVNVDGVKGGRPCPRRRHPGEIFLGEIKS